MIETLSETASADMSFQNRQIWHCCKSSVVFRSTASPECFRSGRLHFLACTAACRANASAQICNNRRAPPYPSPWRVFCGERRPVMADLGSRAIATTSELRASHVFFDIMNKPQKPLSDFLLRRALNDSTIPSCLPGTSAAQFRPS